MFGLFSLGAGSEPAPPAEEPVTALPATCCAHCRLRPVKTRNQILAEQVHEPTRRIRFDDAFEAEGEQLRQAEQAAKAEYDRRTDAWIGADGAYIRRRQQAESGLQRGRSWERSSPDDVASSLAAYERDRDRAFALKVRAEKSWQETHAAFAAHRAERSRREQAIASARIAERDQQRAAERDARGLLPAEENVERFTIRDPRGITDHLRGSRIRV